MRIGCFGVNANPPHLGHLETARIILRSGYVDEVWLIPTFKHPFDKQNGISWEHKVNMCGFLSGIGIHICEVEAEMGGTSYTVDTLRYLREKYPQHTFYWCVGSDIVSTGEFQKWHKWSELKNEAKFLVVERTRFPFYGWAGRKYIPPGGQPPPPCFICIGRNRDSLSSTKIREMVRRGENIARYVGLGIAKYIQEHKLYKEEKVNEFAVMKRLMARWYKNLPEMSLEDLIPDEGAARHTFVFSADMINGFCKKGNLASPRVDAISKPVAELFKRLHGVGVANFALLQEWHSPDAKEFEAFPEHGVMGSEEAETIPELAELPFANKFAIFLKNTLSPAWSYRERRHEPPPYTRPIYPRGADPIFRESFERYLETHDIRTAIVVGNCTDLCVRELAMYLRMWANQRQKDMRVIIPANCVETFDLPFDVAKEIGAMPHPGDLYNLFALYEMARNGIDVVREIL